MRQISRTNKRTVTVTKFEGVDTRYSHRGAPQSIVNFRISADGSLQKREGYGLICDLGESIRAVWTGKLGGNERCYVATSRGVYSVDTQNRTASFIFSLPTTDTHVDFFYYRGALYLVDGVSIYRIENDTPRVPFGYVPLIGKDWADNEVGSINEPRNILNGCGRITYRISEAATSFLRLDAPISSVEALYVNGERLAASKYSVSSSPPVVSVSGLKAYDAVELYFTYADNPYTTDALFKSTHALVFGGINNSRPFLWGGEDGAVIFSSAYVHESELQKSKLIFPESDALYFPVGYQFSVGDGRYPISAVSRHYDRLLIFTEGGAWMADSSACGIEEFPVMNINSSVGVVADTAATLGNQPCTVGLDSVYLWRSETDELDECNAYGISGAINSLLPSEFFKSATVFADTAHGELLFTYPNDKGRTWVYNASLGAWSCFEGIGAERFFNVDGKVGFAKNGAIYAFDKSLDTDLGSTEIVASFSTGLLDFDTDADKRPSAIGICFDGNAIDAEIALDGNSDRTLGLALDKQATHGYVRKRLSARRFKAMSLTLRASGAERQTVHSFYLQAR